MAASRVSCASFNIGSSTTITINRDKSSYTHTLSYTFAGSSMGTIVSKTSQTSYGWTPTASTLYAKIPTTTSGYGVITCQTYDGNTLIGTTTTGFYAYAVKNDCIPTVSATVVDTNTSTIALTGNSSILVKYLSKPKVTVTATAKNSSTIDTINIDMQGQQATTTPYTFNTIYDDYCYVRATDKRGYFKQITSEISNFVLYDLLHFDSCTIKRTESTSTTASLVIKGYCFKGSFGSTSNTLTLKYRYKTSTGSYGSYVTLSPTWNNDGTFSITVSVTGLSTDVQYEFEVNVVDKLMSITSDKTNNSSLILPTGMGDFRIGKNYIQSKNTMIVGDDTTTDFKCVRTKRKVNNIQHFSEYGVSNIDNMAGLILQLYKTVSGTNTRLARYDIRQDGFMYNYQTSMSVAEIMSSAPSLSTSGNQGYMIVNGGDSTTPILIQWGRINKVPDGANVNTYVDINFLHAFSSQPLVHVQPPHNLSTALEAFPNTPSTTGVRLYFKRGNTNNTGLIWLAIGNGTASLPE